MKHEIRVSKETAYISCRFYSDFLAVLFVALCFLSAFLVRPVNSSSQSMTSSNELGDSLQKATIEVFDERTLVLLRKSLMSQCEINLFLSFRIHGIISILNMKSNKHERRRHEQMIKEILIIPKK